MCKLIEALKREADLVDNIETLKEWNADLHKAVMVIN